MYKKDFARRVVAIVSGTLLLGGSASAHGPGGYRGPIIDAHAHIRFGDADALSADQPKGSHPIRLLDQVAGVERSALIVIAKAGQPEKTRAQNDAVIKAASEDPNHFYPVPSVHPADGDNALAELTRLAGLGVREIKLHPNTQGFDVSDPAVAKVTARCGELGLVVLFDSYKPWDTSEMGKLLLLSVSQPKTRFVFAHMGMTEFRETLTFALLRKKMGIGGNVWFDVSAIAVAYAQSPVRPELVWTMRQIGMDRFLFGSDWPVDTPATAVKAVRALGLTPAEQRLVFHDNASNLLHL